MRRTLFLCAETALVLWSFVGGENLPLTENLLVRVVPEEEPRKGLVETKGKGTQ